MINGVDFYYDNFTTDIVLNYLVRNFKIYVNNCNYLLSKCPQPSIKCDYNARWDLKNPYFHSILATWDAAYARGVSINH